MPARRVCASRGARTQTSATSRPRARRATSSRRCATLSKRFRSPPVRANGKVYIIDRADQLRASSANALLKTLEEPPANVTFILLGTSADTILPTIVSRCQCVPFRLISPEAAAQAVTRATGLPLERCRMAVAVAGSPGRATEFLKSASRQEARRAMLRAIGLASPMRTRRTSSSHAKAITLAGQGAARRGQIDAKRRSSSETRSISRVVPSSRLRSANKRELTARERSGIMEVLACARSLLRDALVRVEGISSEPVNADVEDIVGRLASEMASSVSPCMRSRRWKPPNALCRATSPPQLAFEVMLFDIRKALTCPS